MGACRTGRLRAVTALLLLLVPLVLRGGDAASDRLRRGAGAQLLSMSPAERCRDFGDCGPPPPDTGGLLSDPWNPDSPVMVPASTSPASSSASSSSLHITTAAPHANIDRLAANTDIVAPWEIDPSTKTTDARHRTAAETFILERVRQDSPYEGSNFVRALSMSKLNWRLRRTFCGAGHEKNPNCRLWWQRCTTCAASWFIAYWNWANNPNKVLAQAAVADATSAIVRSSSRAIDVSQYSVDILVPYGCRPEKLIDFADRISALKAPVLAKLRILLTNFKCGERPEQYMPSPDLKSLLCEFVGFNDHNQVVIIDPPEEFKDEPFSRGKAMNMLHKACDDKAMVVAMDIDMEFTEGFLDRVRTFVIPGKSVYFPIVWSTYNPAIVDKLIKFYGCERNALGKHYSGVWRSWGYGIYAMYGADAKRHMLSESFIGWGGEDNDWFTRLRDKLHIFRARERGLIHLWHTESCDEKKRSCYASKARLEGPALGFMIDKDGKPTHDEDGF